MGITSYPDGQIVAGSEFEYGQMPTPEEVRGYNLLIVEEVCDTGKTLQHAVELLELAGAGLIRTAVLHYKPEKTQTGFVPDWYADVTNKWVIYPWELHEAVGKKSVVRRQAEEEIAA
jgi:hypoxanthine phosphoribosyltransferase